MRTAICSVILVFSCVGCTSMGVKIKEFLGGKKPEPTKNVTIKKDTAVKYSQKTSVGDIPNKKWQRMNKTRLQDEAELHADAGSLWRMQGQGAYLFAQNTARLVGDLLNVNLSGTPKNQLSTKAKVIKKLLDKIEEQNKRRKLAKLTTAKGAEGDSKKKEEPEKSEQEPSEGDVASSGDEVFKVQVVPTRISKILPDGNYQVSGDQSFMIGKREYKVIVAGIVRAEDFDDQGIEAEKILDPKFDIVTVKK